MPTGPLTTALIRKRFVEMYLAYKEKRRAMVAEIDKLTAEGKTTDVDNLSSRVDFVLARGHFIEQAEALAETMLGDTNA